MKSKEAGPIENANHPPNAEQALAYHAEPRPGKIEMVPLKPCETQEQLSLAYSPGVAEPVKAIVANPEAAYLYTAKGNLVAVISDGTAVLGLGRTGALASKPVMEGKAVLFKRFANIDVFDIEVQTNSIADFIATVVNISPSFGGINLEDIAAPACFEIEQSLREQLDIPVFHDDQHWYRHHRCSRAAQRPRNTGANSSTQPVSLSWERVRRAWQQPISCVISVPISHIYDYLIGVA